MRFVPPLLLLLAVSGCGTPPPPVCAQPEVLTLLRERLERAGTAQYLEVASVNQRPGDRPGLVLCAIRVETASYDTGRYGAGVPVITVGIVPYAVEQRRNGVFLQ